MGELEQSMGPDSDNGRRLFSSGPHAASLVKFFPRCRTVVSGLIASQVLV
jgi:hypothetical protein